MGLNVPYNIRKRIIDIYKAYYQADLEVFDDSWVDGSNFRKLSHPK